MGDQQTKAYRDRLRGKAEPASGRAPVVSAPSDKKPKRDPRPQTAPEPSPGETPAVVTGANPAGFVFSLAMYFCEGILLTLAGLAVLQMLPDTLLVAWLGADSWLLGHRAATDAEVTSMLVFPLVGIIPAMLGATAARYSFVWTALVMVGVPLALIAAAGYLLADPLFGPGSIILAVLPALVYLLRLTHARRAGK